MLRFHNQKFVDSGAPARDFDGELISEEQWQKVKNNDLMQYAEYDKIDKAFKIKRIDTISRIALGERSQSLWNQFIGLV